MAMEGGPVDTRREGGTPPSLRPCAFDVLDPDLEFDRAATCKMPARPASRWTDPSSRGRAALLRMAAWSALSGGVVTAVFLAAFGGRLAPTEAATRSDHARAQVAAVAPAAQRASDEAIPVGTLPDAAPDTSTACETALADLGPDRGRLCTWLWAHAEGRPAGAPPIVAIRALLAARGARKIAGRVVRDALDPGVYQITSSGAWGYCLRAASRPVPGPGDVFWMWARQTHEHASVELRPGRVEECVLLEEAPAGAALDLASMAPGPEASAVATRVLAALR
jgi:hypothetical protein